MLFTNCSKSEVFETIDSKQFLRLSNRVGNNSLNYCDMYELGMSMSLESFLLGGTLRIKFPPRPSPSFMESN